MSTGGTEGRILDAAARCFGIWGPRRTSVDVIAREAGVSKGTVYAHCESKSDLFFRAVRHTLTVWQEALGRELDPSRSAADQLVELAAMDRARVHESPLLAALFLDDEVGRMLPDWAERFEALRRFGRAHVVRVLELGIARGEFAVDVDVEATATVLQRLYLAELARERRGEGDPETTAREQAATMRLVLFGLRHPVS